MAQGPLHSARNDFPRVSYSYLFDVGSCRSGFFLLPSPSLDVVLFIVIGIVILVVIVELVLVALVVVVVVVVVSDLEAEKCNVPRSFLACVSSNSSAGGDRWMPSIQPVHNGSQANNHNKDSSAVLHLQQMGFSKQRTTHCTWLRRTCPSYSTPEHTDEHSCRCLHSPSTVGDSASFSRRATGRRFVRIFVRIQLFRDLPLPTANFDAPAERTGQPPQREREQIV